LVGRNYLQSVGLDAFFHKGFFAKTGMISARNSGIENLPPQYIVALEVFKPRK
jgi:hypothetical protein